MSVKTFSVFTCDNCEHTETSDPTAGCASHDPPRTWLLFLVPLPGSMAANAHHLCPACRAEFTSKVPVQEPDPPPPNNTSN